MQRNTANDESPLPMVRDLMAGFVQRTGLVADGEVTRYLWTDAFAVCNLLALFQRTDDEAFKKLALALIDQVHTVLGKHRADDPRSGWISGLSETDAVQHPTVAGLRIGKAHNERAADEPPDKRLEWGRDGQYFHYLTKWMHALAQAARSSGDVRYLQWALELAKAAHAGFTWREPSAGALRMHWKMSIDLSRPLVASMGHHDPLDALVTYLELQMTTQQLAAQRQWPELGREVDDAIALCTDQDWTTDDPLGLGGLLFDACRLMQIGVTQTGIDGEFLGAVLACADRGLAAWSHRGPLREVADYRLAFRELGLSIGLHALTAMNAVLEAQSGCFVNGARLRRQVAHL